MPGVTVEQLNFELILDDAKFNDEVKKVLADARELNANLTQILEIKQRISKVSADDVANQRNANKVLLDNAKTQEKIARDAAKTAQYNKVTADTTASKVSLENAKNREKEAQAVIKTQMAQERLNQLQRRGQETLKATSKLWRQVAAMAGTYFSVMGATRLVRTLVDVSAEFELQKTTLGAILQSTEKAAEMYEKIKDLAVQSPFNFKELMTYAKQLTAFSVPVGELYNTTKMLADVSAGLGVGMDRLVLAYGQIRSASFLRGQEVRQLTEAGIPILEELRKQFVALGEEGITVGDVFDKISKRLVPFSMVEKVFMDMTSEGGKFYKMQEVQAETLKGKISNLTDAYQIMFSEIGEKHESFLKGSVDALRGIAENYEKIGRVLVGLVATYGAYHAVILLERVSRRAMFGDYDNTLKYYQRFIKALKQMTAESKAYLAVQKALSKINWGALAVGAIIGVGVALANAAIQAKKFRTELDAISQNHADKAEKLASDFKVLVSRLEGATQGSQRYRDAISELNRKYGEYLPNLLTEQTSLAEIKRLEDQVTSAIYARARAYAEAEGMQKIEGRYGKTMNEAATELKNVMVRAGLTDEVAAEFIQNFRDALSKSSDSIGITFVNTLKSYLGETAFDQVRSDANSFWSFMLTDAEIYGKSLRKVTKAQEDFNSTLDIRFGSTTYSSFEQRSIETPILNAIRKEKEALKDMSLSVDEYNRRVKEIDIDKLNRLKQAFSDNEKATKTPGKWALRIKELDDQIKDISGSELSSLQKLVNPLFEGKGNNDLLVEVGDTQVEYAKKLSSEYEGVNKELSLANSVYGKLLEKKKKGLEVDEGVLAKQEQEVNRLKDRKVLIESISKETGILLTTNKGGVSSGGSKKSEAQIALEGQIETMKELYSWYKKFRDLGLSDERIGTVLSKFFPDQKELMDGKKLEDALLDAADALDKYDESAHRAADALRELVRGDSIGKEYDAIKKQIDAFERYRQKVQDWLDKDYGLEGTDISFKASQILARLATQNAQTLTDAAELKKLYAEATKDEEVVKFIRETYGEEAWEKYLKEGEKVIDQLVSDEISANKKAAQEKINALADEYVKRQLFEKNLNLTDWGDKSYAQIINLREALRTMYEAPLDLAPEVQAKAKELGIDLEDLAKAIKQIFGNKMDESTIESFKKVTSIAHTAVGAVSELGGIITTLGDGVDNGDLARLGKMLDTVGEILETITDCESAMVAITGVNEEIVDDMNKLAQSSDLWTMVIKIALIGLRSIVDSVVDNYEYQLAINKAAAEYRDTLHQIAMEDADTIFGTDSVKKAAESIRNLNDRLKEFQKSQSKFSNMYANASGQRQVYWWNDLAKLRGTTFDQIRSEWEAAMNGAYEDNQDFFEWIIANQEIIRNKLYQNERADFDKMIQDLEAYKNALAEYDSMMQDMFGSLADSIADSLINAFIETGDAATDLANNMQGTFSDLGKDIAKSLISSFVISNILNKYKDTVESLFSYMSDTAANPDVIAQKFGELADNITQDADAAAQFTNALMTAMQNNGIDFDSQPGTTAMSNGIKSITEDTANLLASYINAIRADVSVTRTMIATLLGLLPAAPTLSEYLAEIQANTFNTAQNTAEILAELRGSMAAFPNGGRAFNVNIS